MNSAAASRGRFGALRAAEVAKNPSIWDIDVTQSGKMCVTSTSKVQLWRPEADSAVTIKIRSADGQSRTSIGLRATPRRCGRRRCRSSPARNISSNGPIRGDKSSVTFVAVPNTPTDLVGAAQVLIENGCQHQLDLLVDGASKRGEVS